ncbi:DUF397 domain-containing protein [Streptomyces sp. UNOC14_S4]|uniref:DUF397 domain-containing protein n=1 Tax=Streptomyces sp. UNOC14_S4 TaxID=2872340 RepID=UPI001E504E73|nr:DUF397 domain-containing protein [Streptomyces sp. UNOC14_S4]MCC3770740.1 DUF397 domain-containing protein [Streptomyces sp. UNOC14_S4]
MRTATDSSHAIWVKSSYSGGTGGECVEFAPDLISTSGIVPIRDSKAVGGPALVIPLAGWSVFVTHAKKLRPDV